MTGVSTILFTIPKILNKVLLSVTASCLTPSTTPAPMSPSSSPREDEEDVRVQLWKKKEDCSLSLLL